MFAIKRIRRQPFIVWALLVASLRLDIGAMLDDSSYEWQNFDYYTILGLEKDKNREYGAADIKKAYRKQAQMWHPDKVRTASDRKESTARFARISEAYEVLSKADSKRNYDNDLIHGQFANAGYGHQYASWTDYGYQPTDPWTVFDEFFGHGMDDLFANSFADYAFGYGEFGEGPSPYESHAVRTPDRFAQEQQMFVDEQGRQIMRATETHSFFGEDKGFVQTIAQDFLVFMDPYSGAMGYQPLDFEPKILEQAAFPLSPNDTASIEQPQFRDASTLWPGTLMEKGATMKRRPYEMVLTPLCDLEIYERKLVDGDENYDMVWSLEEEEGMGMPLTLRAQMDCVLSLQGEHLVMHSADRPEFVAWKSYSKQSLDILVTGKTPPLHMARLDFDGVLAVYRSESIQVEILGLSKLWQATMLRALPGTLLSKLYIAVWSVVLGGRLSLESKQFVGKITREVCIAAYASPCGCSRLGRWLLRVYRGAKRFVNQFFDKIV